MTTASRWKRNRMAAYYAPPVPSQSILSDDPARRPRISSSSLFVAIVSDLQPLFHFVIDILQGSYFEPMCDSILFSEAARVDQSLRRLLCIAQRQTKIDARLRRRFDLRENMVAIQRHNRLARTGFGVLAHRDPKLQQRIVKRSQVFLLSRKHFLDVLLSSFEISIRIADFFAFTDGSFSQPPRRIRSQLMLFLQPITTRGFRRQTFLLDELNPFIKRSARLLFQPGNPLLRHQNARMHAVDRFALSCVLGHSSTFH